MEHVTRLHSEPESNTGVGQRRGPCLEKRAGCIPGELGDVTPHQAGLKQFVDGTSLTDFLFKVSILSNSVSSVICSTASREGCGASAGTLHHGFSIELKLLYGNDRCVSQAINWDSLLISSWFLHEITLGLFTGS